MDDLCETISIVKTHFTGWPTFISRALLTLKRMCSHTVKTDMPLCMFHIDGKQMYICSVFRDQKFTRFAGRLEECDSTLSQFVQLFDLWMQELCTINSSPAGGICWRQCTELADCSKTCVWGVIVGECKTALEKQCKQQNCHAKYSLH